MTKRIDWDEYFLSIAKAVSVRASCPRADVGALAVSPDHRILATGYNGAPAGLPDCLDQGCTLHDRHCTRAIHAELNVIAQAARHGVSVRGSTIYVSFSPKHFDTVLHYKTIPLCYNCRNAIRAASVHSVIVRINDKSGECSTIFREDFALPPGFRLLDKSPNVGPDLSAFNRANVLNHLKERLDSTTNVTHPSTMATTDAHDG